jgi:hypothetical protein
VLDSQVVVVRDLRVDLVVAVIVTIDEVVMQIIVVVSVEEASRGREMIIEVVLTLTPTTII